MSREDRLVFALAVVFLLIVAMVRCICRIQD